MEKRREERANVRLAVKLDRGSGITRNISSSGAYFESSVSYEPGNTINFIIELDGPRDKKLVLWCQGLVNRVENREAKLGIAIANLVSQTRVAISGSRQLTLV